MIELVNDNMLCANIEEPQTGLLNKEPYCKHLLLEATFNSSSLAYFIVDNKNDKIMYFNNKFCTMWGIEHLSDKIKNGKLKNCDIIPYCLELVVDQSKFIETYKSLHYENDRITIEDEILFKDGRVIKRFSRQLYDEFDNHIGRVFIFNDITKRKKSEIDLNHYQKRMEAQLEYITRHDYLTNTPNRFYLEEFLSNIYTNIKKREDALLIIDLDNFKIINDSYGHSTGDKVLICVADCINKKLRDNDFIARLGGDEFAIFLSNTNLKGAQVVAHKILNALEHEPYFITEDNIQVNVTASIGIIMIDDVIDLKRLFSYADAALYAAKENGKNRAVTLKNGRDKNLVVHNNRILTLIQDALKKDKFQIYLQPIYKSGDDLLHYEALIRMFGKNNNILLPSSFIPLAERYGLMPSIDQWVIKNIIKLLTKEKNLNIFINLSGISLCDDTLLEWIEFTLKNSDINPNQIGFEITETTAIKDLEKARIWICKLKALGCQFALDDFGVGFSSFSYLNILPVDYLKIDGTFVRDLDSDSTKLALVKAMNMVAHALGKKTIAEFVENESIWRMLKELGVDYGQGYYLGKPAPFIDISNGINN